MQWGCHQDNIDYIAVLEISHFFQSLKHSIADHSTLEKAKRKSRRKGILIREVFFVDDQVRECLMANENKFLNEIKKKFPCASIDLGLKNRIKLFGSPSADKVKHKSQIQSNF